MSTITLGIGRKYRTRHGKEIKIIKTIDIVSEPGKIFFQSNHFTIYDDAGKVRFHGQGEDDRWTIVEEIEDPTDIAPMLVNNGDDG